MSYAPKKTRIRLIDESTPVYDAPTAKFYNASKRPLTYFLAQLAKEQEESKGPVVAKKAELTEQIEGISKKLDRLVDAHLDGIIDRPTYLSKKESLLNQRAELDGKLSAVVNTPTGPFDNLRMFTEAAHRADLLATASDLAALRNFFQKICSTARLSGKTLNFSYGLPWSILAENRASKNWRPRVVARSTLCGHTEGTPNQINFL
ncbi:MAG TPA: hypothetical protein VI895_08545 [Bdellovibrionota bacterium]|nr:hypothetical protein [Bdellovibrionota bacterium]